MDQCLNTNNVYKNSNDLDFWKNPTYLKNEKYYVKNALNKMFHVKHFITL